MWQTVYLEARGRDPLEFVHFTRQRRAPGKRHQDLVSGRDPATRPALAFPAVRGVERELPVAVEIEPLRALKIGARMLGKWNAIGGANEERENEVHAP